MPALRQTRYEYATVHEDECGRTFLDVPAPIKRVKIDDDERVTPGAGTTLFTLAWLAYETMLDRETDIRPSGYWWAIALDNDILDPTQPLPAVELVIPSVESVEDELLVPPPFFSAEDVVT